MSFSSIVIPPPKKDTCGKKKSNSVAPTLRVGVISPPSIFPALHPSHKPARRLSPRGNFCRGQTKRRDRPTLGQGFFLPPFSLA